MSVKSDCVRSNPVDAFGKAGVIDTTKSDKHRVSSKSVPLNHGVANTSILLGRLISVVALRSLWPCRFSCVGVVQVHIMLVKSECARKETQLTLVNRLKSWTRKDSPYQSHAIQPQ